MAASPSPIVPEEAQLVVHETRQENLEYEKYLVKLTAINGADLVAAGRLGQRQIDWVKELDSRAAVRVVEVKNRLAPTRQKLHEAWQEFCRLEDDLTAPARAILEKTKSIKQQYKLEGDRLAEIDAARLREEQRRAAEEQRQLQEEEAQRLRAEADKLTAQGEEAAAEEKQLEAEFIATQPIVPIAITARQIAAPKVDQGHVVYWRRVINWQLFLNWVLKLPSQTMTLAPRADDSNETVLRGLDFTIAIKFGSSWKTKGDGADIPGVIPTKSYQSVSRIGRR